MKPATKKLSAILTAAALSAGCASGGGHGDGGGNSNSKADTPEELMLCIFLPFLCLLKNSVSAAPASSGVASGSAPAVPFTKWSELARGAETEAGSVTTGASPEASERVSYPSSGATMTLAAAGQPGIEVRDAAIVANPYVLGWEYQSFGIWNTHGSSTGAVRASSFGAATPASAVPTSGSAAFSGKLAGLYVSPAGQTSTAAADLSVNANFSTRSLNFSSIGTTLTRDTRTATAAPNLNLGGTLTYSPGSGSFTGTLTNSGGTLSGSSKGQFYGPAAQELGGVFTLKSPTTAETFVGAYGAKR